MKTETREVYKCDYCNRMYQRKFLCEKHEVACKKYTKVQVGPNFNYSKSLYLNETKPILHPLSDLTKEIEHKGGRFIPVEWFENGDGGGESLEYDYGNIKLINTLESIAKYNILDINYLPYGVVEKLHEWHFDLHRLIERGLAIDINTLDHA